MKLTNPLFQPFGHAVSGRDLILLGGGAFLIAKATWEIHDKLEASTEHGPKAGGTARFGATLVQIVLLDIVFSLDSVITAVGMVSEVAVMVLAIVVAVGVMMFAAKPIGDFVDGHPTIKMLALSFLILVGVALIGEGFAMHIPKGYIYFAMAFSVAVEMLNLRLRKKRQPVRLHKEMSESEEGGAG
jgi:predicted tellurium resistance membrane protein TerC